MPITSAHPDYCERYCQWERCRDAYDGQDAIKRRGHKYLPRLGEQTQDDYDAYKDRALFFSITQKTISALVGMATVRQPVVKFPDKMAKYYKEDQGVQFFEIFTNTLSENLLMGRIGLMIDWPQNGGDARISRYVAESIINWDLNPDGTPLWVVLKECVLEQEKDDKYEKEYVDQYRLLTVESGQYEQHLFNEKGELLGSVTPLVSGNPLDFIPFYVANPFGVGFQMERPPVLDIVDINISHYRTSADLEHGRHFTALPTPVVSGADSTTPLKVGSQTAWVLPDPSARASFLEFTGQGLQSLEKALTEKQSQLASMSARMLDNSRRGSESPDTVRLRYASETASLSMNVRATEAALNLVYKTIAKFEGLDPNDVSIVLNKEFLDSRMQSSQVVDLVQSYIDGGMSEETLIFNLRRGDVLSIERSDEEEVAALKATKMARETLQKSQQQSRQNSSSHNLN